MPKWRTAALLMFVVAAVGLLASGALAKFTKLTVSPKSPNVDTQRITVSFIAPFALKPGWRWDGLLTVLSGGDLSCAATEDKKAGRPTKKGQRVKLTFTPEHSIESITGTKFKWCQAAAKVAVTTTKGSKVGRTVGFASFRIRP